MADPLLKSSASKAGLNWTGLFKILVVQVAALLVLAAAAISYINWTSDTAVAEFMSTHEQSLPAVPLFSESRRVASSSKQQCDKPK
jgi:hypothetical protein